jgi:hypothetical protein
MWMEVRSRDMKSWRDVIGVIIRKIISGGI